MADLFRKTRFSVGNSSDICGFEACICGYLPVSNVIFAVFSWETGAV
jgi:hypothetical protein